MLEKIKQILANYEKDNSILDKYEKVEQYLILELIKLRSEYTNANQACVELSQKLEQAKIILNNTIAMQNKFIEDLGKLLEKRVENE